MTVVLTIKTVQQKYFSQMSSVYTSANGYQRQHEKSRHSPFVVLSKVLLSKTCFLDHTLCSPQTGILVHTIAEGKATHTTLQWAVLSSRLKEREKPYVDPVSHRASAVREAITLSFPRCKTKVWPVICIATNLAVSDRDRPTATQQL